MRRNGNAPLTNREAWSAFESFQGDERIGLRTEEPEGLDSTWKKLAIRGERIAEAPDGRLPGSVRAGERSPPRDHGSRLPRLPRLPRPRCRGDWRELVSDAAAGSPRAAAHMPPGPHRLRAASSWKPGLISRRQARRWRRPVSRLVLLPRRGDEVRARFHPVRPSGRSGSEPAGAQRRFLRRVSMRARLEAKPLFSGSRRSARS